MGTNLEQTELPQSSEGTISLPSSVHTSLSDPNAAAHLKEVADHTNQTAAGYIPDLAIDGAGNKSESNENVGRSNFTPNSQIDPGFGPQHRKYEKYIPKDILPSVTVDPGFGITEPAKDLPSPFKRNPLVDPGFDKVHE